MNIAVVLFQRKDYSISFTIQEDEKNFSFFTTFHNDLSLLKPCKFKLFRNIEAFIQGWPDRGEGVWEVRRSPNL